MTTRPQTTDHRPQAALRIVRPLPAGMQTLREQVIVPPMPVGKVVFAPVPAASSRRPQPAQPTAAGSTPARSELDRELRELEAEKAKLERVVRLRDEVGQLRVRAAIAENTADSLCRIIALVAARTGCTADQIIGPKRTEAIAWPRHLVCHLARHATNLTLQRIADGLSGRDHGTILHSVRAVATRRDLDASFTTLVNELEAEAVRMLAGKPEGKPC